MWKSLQSALTLMMGLGLWPVIGHSASPCEVHFRIVANPPPYDLQTLRGRYDDQREIMDGIWTLNQFRFIAGQTRSRDVTYLIKKGVGLYLELLLRSPLDPQAESSFSPNAWSQKLFRVRMKEDAQEILTMLQEILSWIKVRETALPAFRPEEALALWEALARGVLTLEQHDLAKSLIPGFERRYRVRSVYPETGPELPGTTYLVTEKRWVF